MIKLEALKNETLARKRRKLLGRGPSSGHGKTSCRGHKGDGARSGYKRRYGYEGGGVPLFRRLPVRGFSNARFADKPCVVTADRLQIAFQDGDTVSLETLKSKKIIKSRVRKVKVLLKGEFERKLNWADGHAITFSTSVKNIINPEQGI